MDVKMDVKFDVKPKLLMIKEQNVIANIEVNVAEGHANETLAELTQHKVEQSATSDTVCKWKAEGCNLQEAVDRGKRVTSGLAYAHKKPVLNSEYRDIVIAKRQKKDDSEKNVLVGKMKKIYLLLYKCTKLMTKYENSLDLDKLNNSELKICATWHARSRDDPVPSTNDALLNRTRDAKHRGDTTLLTCLIDIGVDEDKLTDMSVCPNEEEFLEQIDKEITDKANEEAAKSFNAVVNKHQKEKDKFTTLTNNLKSIADRLFDGCLNDIDDAKLKLLKDLKVYVVLKTLKEDDPAPTTIVKLRERLNSIRNRPFINLRTYLVCRGCDRDDVLDTLCS